MVKMQSRYGQNAVALWSKCGRAMIAEQTCNISNGTQATHSLQVAGSIKLKMLSEGAQVIFDAHNSYIDEIFPTVNNE